MTFANVLFAGMAISARLASRSAHWSTIAGSRALIGAIVALAVALVRGAPIVARSRGLSWARSLLGTVSMLTTFYALGSAELALGDASTLFATSPLFIAILSPWILKEPTERSVWAILIVAFLGVAMVAGPHLSFGSLPAASSLTAALFSALAMMFLRKMRSGKGGVGADGAEAIALHFGLVAFSVFFCFNLRYFRNPTPVDWFFVVGAGLAGGIAQLAMTRAYALVEAARLGAISYVGTVLSLAGAFLLLDERPSLVQLLGAALVIGAGTVLAWTSARSHPTSPASMRAT